MSYGLGFTPQGVEELYRQALAGDQEAALVWLDAAQEMGTRE